MNLVVGNRVTYKDLSGKVKMQIIDNEGTKYALNEMVKKGHWQVLKVEACNWETIEFVEE